MSWVYTMPGDPEWDPLDVVDGLFPPGDPYEISVPEYTLDDPVPVPPFASQPAPPDAPQPAPLIAPKIEAPIAPPSVCVSSWIRLPTYRKVWEMHKDMTGNDARIKKLLMDIWVRWKYIEAMPEYTATMEYSVDAGRITFPSVGTAIDYIVNRSASPKKRHVKKFVLPERAYLHTDFPL